MPKRRVKRVSWERESENMVVTTSMARRTRTRHIAAAPEALAEYRSAQSPEDQFYTLPRAALAAYDLSQFEEAGFLASQALELAPSFEDNWNYANAMHTGHTVLGLLALHCGNQVAAIAELHASGAVRGSPQLASFGPSMRLAKALLLQGASTEVLEYLGQCRKFWEHGSEWLRIWEQKIQRGAVPNFFKHSYL
jgi:tetratricopeptide (TPR) repeat protein